MANVVSMLNKVNQIPRIWRFVLLFALSQALAATPLRENLLELIRGKQKEEKVEGEKKIALVPYASKGPYWFASLFLGHFADFAPWKNKGVVVNMLNYRFKWYKTVEDQNSKSVRVKLVTDDFVFTHDLEMIRAICGKEDRLFRNSDTIRRAWGVLFPDSMTVRTGEKWKRVRRVFVSAMSKLDFDVLPPSTNEVLEMGLHNYVTEDVQEVFLWDCFAKVTFDSFHKFVYNINFNTVSGENLQVLEDLMTIATRVSDRLLVSIPLIWKLPTETNRILWECHARLCSFVDGYVEERTKALAAQPVQNSKKSITLLDALIVASKEDASEKKSLTKEELRAQLAAAMFGGFDTTTSSMSMITVNLSQNPECQEKLYEEIKDVDLSKSTADDLGDLPYLNSVIKETLRRNAVAPMNVRIPNEDVVINGKLLKEGTNIMADHERLGLEPEYWNGATDLHEFKPERWIDFTPTPGTYFPFGFGARQCPGYKMATSQMQVITTFLVQNYKISKSSRPVKIVSSMGRTVSRDTSVIFTKRRSLKTVS